MVGQNAKELQSPMQWDDIGFVARGKMKVFR